MHFRLITIAVLLLSSLAAEPIRLHPDNPHYFLYRGRPTIIVTSGEHYGAVLNPDFDYRKYLDALSADGMNYTRVFSGSYVEASSSFGIRRNTLAPRGDRFLAPWARSTTPGYAAGGKKFDLDRWDLEYFPRVRDFVAEAGKRGIVVEMTLFSSHYNDAHWAISPFNPANNVNGTNAIDRRRLHTLSNGNILARHKQLVGKIVRELNAFDNVIFEIQNEPWSDRTVVAGSINPYLKEPALLTFPNSVDLADADSLAWQKQVAAWIGEEEKGLPNRHLIAQNYCNFRYPVREVAPGVSIVNFHYAYPEAATANYGLGKVIGYDETGFLGVSSDAGYRAQAWNFILSGGGLFNNLDYSFTVGREDGTDTEPNGPGGGSPALRRQLKVLSDFIQSFDFVKMHPDSGIVRRAPGAYTRLLAAPGQQYALYVSGASPVRVEMWMPPGSWTAAWVDTKTGATVKTETFAHGGGERAFESPAFSEDIALGVKRAGAGPARGKKAPARRTSRRRR